MIFYLLDRFTSSAYLKKVILNLEIANSTEINFFTCVLQHFDEKDFSNRTSIVFESDFIYNGFVNI